MKTIKFLTAMLIVGGLLAPSASFSASHDAESSVGEFVKDSVITSKIKARLAAEKGVSAIHIMINTDKNGVVVMSGTAGSQAEIDKAHSIAHSVEGVTKVINHIKIKKEH
jgi:hyperosmotically inducible protein